MCSGKNSDFVQKCGASVVVDYRQDGYIERIAEHGPYDVVIIQGGVEQVPDALLAQVKNGGRIAAIFVDHAIGDLRVGYKIDGRINWRSSFNATAPILLGFEKCVEFTL